MPHLQRAIRYSTIQFTRSSKSTGLLLIICTVLSLLLTNLPIGEKYVSFWENKNAILLGTHLPASIAEWVNDGCMALFFLMAGMEIKQELKEGELSSVKKAILPLLAAVGGVIVPATIYLLLNKGTTYAHGWGIPTATDIAFSIGIMSLLGRRYVPSALKIFLTALAIVDDLAAIVIVAFFYGGAIQWFWLLLVLILVAVLFWIFKRPEKKNILALPLGILLWYAMYRSGIHATMAGVIFGFLIPVRQMPKWTHRLHIPVNFFIIPFFALVNTCVPFDTSVTTILGHSLFWGIALGLFLGKVLGIVTVSYILIRLGWAVLPSHTSWQQFVGAGILAGIGFTMSIFIATLAFENAEWQHISKIAILAGSCLSMIIGYCWLRFCQPFILKN